MEKYIFQGVFLPLVTISCQLGSQVTSRDFIKVCKKKKVFFGSNKGQNKGAKGAIGRKPLNKGHAI